MLQCLHGIRIHVGHERLQLFGNLIGWDRVHRHLSASAGLLATTSHHASTCGSRGDSLTMNFFFLGDAAWGEGLDPAAAATGLDRILSAPTSAMDSSLFP